MVFVEFGNVAEFGKDRKCLLLIWGLLIDLSIVLHLKPCTALFNVHIHWLPN